MRLAHKIKATLRVLLLLTISVSVHEMGHYTMLRAFHVPIEGVSLGFGPQLLVYHGSENTTWSLRLIPLGGYVSPAKEFLTRPPVQRLIVSSAGITFAMIFAFLLFLVVPFWTWEHPLDGRWHSALRASFGTMLRGVKTLFGIVFHPRTFTDDFRDYSKSLRVFDGHWIWLLGMFTADISALNIFPLALFDGSKILWACTAILINERAGELVWSWSGPLMGAPMIVVSLYDLTCEAFTHIRRKCQRL
ncbi:MAG: site-2 protease family protein [bacterium]|nr:site-2 protease family protein [bacterium]